MSECLPTCRGVIDVDFESGDSNVDVDFGSVETLYKVANYADLVDKPSINGHTLVSGENSLAELGIGKATTADIDAMFS